MNCAIKRIIQFHNAYVPGPIQIKNQMGQDITTYCQYSWSNDMVCWTNWVTYDMYLKICGQLKDETYIRILIQDSIGIVKIHDVATDCYSVTLDLDNPFEVTICNDNLFNPYANLDCAIKLQQQMADSIICMFGIPVYYFRVKPDPTTADYTFKEYLLHNIESVKQIKMMIPEGTMPSSNPKFNALDFDWETDWDVEIGKNEFARAFGDGQVPKVRDFIYIPMMKRMWDVNSAYDEKNENLMWISTTWKLSLVKYEDTTNVNGTPEMESLIDSLIPHTYENTFGEKERTLWERTTGSTQIKSPDHAYTNLYDISMGDAIRQAYSKNEINIVDYQYNHNSMVVTRNIYKFKTPLAKVTYQKGYCGANGTLAFILQTTGTSRDELICSNCRQKTVCPYYSAEAGAKCSVPSTIIKCGPIDVNLTLKPIAGGNCYEISCGDIKGNLKLFASYLVIIRWNRQNYTVSMECYEHIHRTNIPTYMLKPEMYSFNATPTISVTSQYNLDYDITEEQDMFIQAYPCLLTNIKLYNIDLGREGAIKESLKYVTQHKNIIINDLARPIESGQGYTAR